MLQNIFIVIIYLCFVNIEPVLQHSGNRIRSRCVNILGNFWIKKVFCTPTCSDLHNFVE